MSKKVHFIIILSSTILLTLATPFVTGFAELFRFQEMEMLQFQIGGAYTAEERHRANDIGVQFQNAVFAERLVNHWPEYLFWNFLISTVLLAVIEAFVRFVNRGIDYAELLLRSGYKFAKRSIRRWL